MTNKEQKASLHISFAAIDPYVDGNIPLPTESRSNSDRIRWGTDDKYPEFLLALAQSAPTLRSIISGTVDFIVGDDLHIQALDGTTYKTDTVNTRGDSIRSQVKQLAHDWETFGGFALQIIRSKTGKVVELYHCPIRYLRTNKDNTVFYYSERWGDRPKVVTYPAFFPYTPEAWAALDDKQRAAAVSSILFVKDDDTHTYPLPIYCAAIKACETERCVADYHLNAVNNCFASSMIINFNNGQPTDEERKEIERSVNEKFSGHQNAGRIMLSWNDNKDLATTIETPKIERFGEHYTALSSSVRQQIFTAFRANPNLFGIPTENLGFSQEEYESAFRLYNRTHVRPVQRIICEAYDRIYGKTGVLTITPFSLDEDKATETNVN